MTEDFSYVQNTQPQWSRCGNFIVYRVNKDLCIARSDTLKPEDGDTNLKHTGEIWSPKFSPDGEYLAVGSGRHEVFLWKWSANPSDRRLIKTVKGTCKFGGGYS